MSFDKIQKLINNATNQIQQNEELSTLALSHKLDQTLQSNPGDQTMGMINRVIESMIDKKSMFISRADLQKLYQNYFVYGTQFGNLFQSELGIKTAEAKITYASKSYTNPLQYQAEDQVLVNALESVLDKQPLRSYSKALGNQAVKSVNASLEGWNLAPNKLTVQAGNEKFIVVQADYETPKGLTSFYVPVEVSKNQIFTPELFMGNGAPQDLNYSNIRDYVVKSAGSTLLIKASDILNVLTTASTQKREINEAEMAVIRLNAKRSSTAPLGQQVLGQKMETVKSDVSTPKFEQTSSFEKRLSTAAGQAEWKYGDKINIARDQVVRQLISLGYRNAQVVLAKADDKVIYFGVSADTGKLAFTVPVKVKNGQLEKPTVILCEGEVASFDQQGINKLITANRLDYKAAAVASCFASVKPSEVVDAVRNAMLEGNHAKAEDALNVLANSDDEKAYQTALHIFMDGLAGKTAKPVEACKHTIKTAKAVSEFPICSQTGLPVNKVYQDADGNCRPLYRRAMNETYQAVAMNSSKIVLG